MSRITDKSKNCKSAVMRASDSDCGVKVAEGRFFLGIAISFKGEGENKSLFFTYLPNAQLDIDAPFQNLSDHLDYPAML
jgi:hypothetical protein